MLIGIELRDEKDRGRAKRWGEMEGDAPEFARRETRRGEGHNRKNWAKW